MARAIFVVVLALRLVVDMATPLLPGAYHFGPAESIEAHRPAASSAAQVVMRPTMPQRIAAHEVIAPEQETRPRVAPARRQQDPRRAHPALDRDHSPDAAEDH